MKIQMHYLGKNKIHLIKHCRSAFALDLRQAKDLVETVNGWEPVVVEIAPHLLGQLYAVVSSDASFDSDRLDIYHLNDDKTAKIVVKNRGVSYPLQSQPADASIPF